MWLRNINCVLLLYVYIISPCVLKPEEICWNLNHKLSGNLIWTSSMNWFVWERGLGVYMIIIWFYAVSGCRTISTRTSSSVVGMSSHIWSRKARAGQIQTWTSRRHNEQPAGGTINQLEAQWTSRRHNEQPAGGTMNNQLEAQWTSRGTIVKIQCMRTLWIAHQ